MIMTFTVILVPQAFAQEFTKSTFFENVVVVYDLKLYKESGNFLMKKASGDAVSYTHLTLPTICSV